MPTAASRRNSVIGLKELWQVAPEKHRPGLVQHTIGWPLDNRTGGGSFLYHFGDNLVSVGFVVHLNYANPYLSPFEEFQRFKTHPLVRDTFAGGKRICYGARAITEGGWQSVPKLAFPGGALIGCAAGFLNVPRIKGSHNAMLSGMLAARAHRRRARRQGRGNDELVRLRGGLARFADRPATSSACATPSRCGRSSAPSPASRSAASTCGPTRSAFRCSARSGTASPISPRSSRRRECRPIAYPKPDGKLTFDRLSSVYLSNTNHEEDQPVHLLVRDPALQKSSEHDVYAGPSARYCPAGVYEWVEEGGQSALRHQRAELRPLQDLRHQGPQPEHHLGPARRRRRAELSEYVSVHLAPRAGRGRGANGTGPKWPAR